MTASHGGRATVATRAAIRSHAQDAAETRADRYGDYRSTVVAGQRAQAYYRRTYRGDLCTRRVVSAGLLRRTRWRLEPVGEQ